MTKHFLKVKTELYFLHALAILWFLDCDKYLGYIQYGYISNIISIVKMSYFEILVHL